MSPLSSSRFHIPMTRILNTPISIAVDREMYNTKVIEDDGDINEGEKDMDRNNSSGNEFNELTIRDERQATDKNFNREISRIKIGDGNEDWEIERYIGEDHRKKAVERSAIVLGGHRDKELNLIVGDKEKRSRESRETRFEGSLFSANFINFYEFRREKRFLKSCFSTFSTSFFFIHHNKI